MRTEALYRPNTPSPVQPWPDPTCPSLCTCNGSQAEGEAGEAGELELRSHLHVGVLLPLHAVDHRVGVIQLVWKQPESTGDPQHEQLKVPQ